DGVGAFLGTERGGYGRGYWGGRAPGIRLFGRGRQAALLEREVSEGVGEIDLVVLGDVASHRRARRVAVPARGAELVGVREVVTSVQGGQRREEVRGRRRRRVYFGSTPSAFQGRDGKPRLGRRRRCDGRIQIAGLVALEIASAEGERQQRVGQVATVQRRRLSRRRRIEIAVFGIDVRTELVSGQQREGLRLISAFDP